MHVISGIRITRNVTIPKSSHSIQALRPSNLGSMGETFHMEDKSLQYTLQLPIHYGPNATGFTYPEPGPHAYHNPPSGSLLTKAASWPPEVARALGFDQPPQYELTDSNWWTGMGQYAALSPANKTLLKSRYRDWDPRFPSTYPRYQVRWPNNSWNGALWPAHLYGTLPTSWGSLNSVTNKAMLPNLRIM